MFERKNQLLYSPSVRPLFILHLLLFFSIFFLLIINISIAFFLSFSQFNMDQANTEEFLEVYKGVVTEYTVSRADLMPHF